jgi:hypothetical protein
VNIDSPGFNDVHTATTTFHASHASAASSAAARAHSAPPLDAPDSALLKAVANATSSATSGDVTEVCLPYHYKSLQAVAVVLSPVVCEVACPTTTNHCKRLLSFCRLLCVRL